MAGTHDIARDSGMKVTEVETVFSSIVEKCKNGERVLIKNFGSFERKDVSERIIKSPQIPGGTATVKPHSVIKFKPSPQIKAILAGEAAAEEPAAEPAAEEAKPAPAPKAKPAAAAKPATAKPATEAKPAATKPVAAAKPAAAKPATATEAKPAAAKPAAAKPVANGAKPAVAKPAAKPAPKPAPVVEEAEPGDEGPSDPTE